MAANPEFPLLRFEQVNRPISEARRIFEQRMIDAVHIYEKYHRDFVTRPCPVCGYPDYDPLEKFHGTYGVSRCQQCAALYVNPVPNLEALTDYYNNCACNLMLQDLYKRRSTGPKNFIMDDRVEMIVARIRSRIAQAHDKTDILEIGCGSGRFLANLNGVLEEQGLREKTRLTGVDIDRNAVALNTDSRLDLRGMPIESFLAQTSKQFDILLHFELIEHLADPFEFMNNCKKLLKDGGMMIFTTPNMRGFELAASDYNGFRLIAHGIFPPMHLNAFSTDNVSLFVIRCGFKIKSITTPGNLDADMVTVMKDELTDPGFVAFTELDDHHKGLFQYLLKKLGCSSHMLIVAGK